MASFPPDGFIPTESALAGVTVFMPTPVHEAHERVVAFRCAQCNGEVAYSATDGGITCNYCGYHEAPDVAVVGKSAETFEFKVETVEQASHGWGTEREEIVCQTCASHIVVAPDELTTSCPFCNSNKVIHHRAAQDVLRPRFLVPFQINDDQCHAKVREWLGSSWLVPAKLQQFATVGEFAPLYLPFWTFDAQADARWRAEIGYARTKTDWNGKKTTVIEWKWESGSVDHFYQNVKVRGTERLNRKHIASIQRDFDLQELVKYNPSFLAGAQAIAYEKQLEPSWAAARSAMRERMKQKCRGAITHQNVRNFSMSVEFDKEAWRYLLLPVYVASYHYNNEPYQLLVNGQTGLVAGQRPADWRKIALIAGIPLLLAFLTMLWQTFVQTSDSSSGPGLVIMLALVGLILGVVLSIQGAQLNDA
ncbi:MAG: hypothetical protein ACPG8W_13575 [Candidatus Promineifilaceae bacterium]